MQRASQSRLAVCLVGLLVFLTLLRHGLAQELPPTTSATKALIANSAVQTISEIPDASKVDVLTNVKAATDGIQLAIHSAAAQDTSRMLKGIGDAVATLPGALGFAGIAFSVAASAFALFGGGGKKDDPVLAALHQLHSRFDKEMVAIETALGTIDTKVDAIITGIDLILSGISEIPAKVVAEMKLTDVTTMKDKFAHVQRASQQYARGNLTRDQMVAKCDDFQVASLFSELETLLKDEKELFRAKFGTQDRANGRVQLQLLVFYMAIVPLVTNCNALKYSLESLRADGEKIQQLISNVHARAVWYLSEPDRTIHVYESFSPFATMIDTSGTYKSQSGGGGGGAGGSTLALSFKAYSFAPPRATCFETVDNGKRLVALALKPREKVPKSTAFCVKNAAGDDAPQRIVYAERTTSDGSVVAILQPESGTENTDFDPLNARGWTSNAVAMYSQKAAHWIKLPRLRVITDLLLLQAKNKKVTIDEITTQCRALGNGYDRDGDAHSKDYDSAPLTIFCVKSLELTLRELDSGTHTFLSGIQFNDMEAREAWTATCPEQGFYRDYGEISIPSKIKKQFFGGYSTLRAYAVCLKWEAMALGTAPSQFIQRVWFDDSVAMAEKPKFTRHASATAMALPAPPPATELAAF